MWSDNYHAAPEDYDFSNYLTIKPEEVKPADLEINRSSITFPANGNTSSITVRNDGDETLYWDAIQRPNWISMSSTEGVLNGGDSYTISLIAGKNTSSDKRDSTIVFMDQNNFSEQETVSVSQEGQANENEPPVVTITKPYSGTTTDAASVFVYGTANDPDGGSIAQVQIRVNSGAWASANGTADWSKAVALQDGSNTISVKAKDDEGDYSSVKSVSVTVNTVVSEKPIVNITAPTSGTPTDAASLFVYGTANDPDGGNIAQVQIRVNSGVWASANGTADWSKTVALQDGSNTISVKAKDDEGDYSSVKSITVTKQSVVGEDKAHFISEEIPDGTILTGASPFTKTWKIENTGTTTWNSGYKLRYVDGIMSNNKSDKAIVGTVPPGAFYTFTVNMTAPNSSSQTKEYTENWKFVGPNGNVIKVDNSSTLYAKIVVPRENTPVPTTDWMPHSDGFDYPVNIGQNGTSASGWHVQAGRDFEWVNDQYVANKWHLGEDWNYASGSSDLYKPIYAASSGKVVYAKDAGTGWNGVIIIEHYVPETKEKFTTLYGHVKKESINGWVREGEWVYRGQQIGIIGETPAGSTAPHLHFEMRTNQNADPGPGYSASNTGWRDPGDYIDAHRPDPNLMSTLMQAYSRDGIIKFSTAPDGKCHSDVKNQYYVEKRCEFIKILIASMEEYLDNETLNKLNLNPIGSLNFKDVPENEWFYEWILKANNLSILKNGDEFRPYEPITRLEALEYTVAVHEALFSSDQNGYASTDWNSPFAAAIFEDVKFGNAGFETTQKGYAKNLTSGIMKDGKRYFYPERWVPRMDAVSFVDKLITLIKTTAAYRNAQITLNETINEQFEIVPGFSTVKIETIWPGSDIDMVISTPSGKTVAPTDAMVQDFYDGDTKEYYIINTDEEGVWNVDLVGVDVDPAGEAYQFTATVEQQDSASEDGLAGHWKLDETQGNVAKDSSANGNDGEIYGAPARTEGMDGGAYDFTGDGNLIKLPGTWANYGPENFSVVMWMNVKQNKSFNYLFHSSDDRPGIVLGTENNLWFKFKSSGSAEPHYGLPGGFQTEPLPMNEWMHLVMTWDGSVFKGYVNGTLAGSKELPYFTPGSTVKIGSDGGSVRSFDGLIDDVKIYTRALADTEIQLMADTDKDGLPDGWEKSKFGDLSHDGSGDEDNDGLNNKGEYGNKTDPNNPDSDGDEMPDGWEADNGLNPNDPADAWADTENNGIGDGVINKDEYINQTDPNVDDYYTVTGTITYTGDQTGTLYVNAYAATDTEPAETIEGWNDSTGSMTYTLIVPDGVYTLKAFIDANENETLDADEAQGKYNGDVTISGGDDTASRDIELNESGTSISEQKIFAGDGAAADLFGSTSAMDGDYAVVGAPQDGNRNGAAYLFNLQADKWVQIAKLTASDGMPGDYFGIAVDITGDTIIVGNGRNDKDPVFVSGAAYIFEKPADGWQDMTETAKLTFTESSTTNPTTNRFGYSVAVSEQYAVVGAAYDSSEAYKSGALYVFEKSTEGWKSMSETVKLKSEDIQKRGGVGTSVDLLGDSIAAGASGCSDMGDAAGAAYIFKRENGVWGQKQKLLAEDGKEGESFGFSVSLSENYLAVGAIHYYAEKYGSAYIFERTDTMWRQAAKLLSSDVEQADRFGYSISVSEDRALVGAWGTDDHGADSGSVYIFEKPEDGWKDATETKKYTPSDADARDRLGYSVAHSGAYAIAGACWDKDKGETAGAAYIFSLTEDVQSGAENKVTLVPSATTVETGGKIFVEIRVEADGLWAMHTSVKNDPDMLEVKPRGRYGDFFDPTKRFKIEIASDMLEGTWVGALTMKYPAEPISGEGVFAQNLTYKALPGVYGKTKIIAEATLTDKYGNELPVSEPIETVITIDDGLHVEGGTVITGTVVLPDGTPVEGVEVTIKVGGKEQTVITGKDGSYRFEDLRGLEDGEKFTIEASKDDFHAETEVTSVDQSPLPLPPLEILNTLLADLNSDGKVTMADFTILAGSYGTQTGDADFDVRADIKKDGKIDIKDLALFGSHWKLP